MAFQTILYVMEKRENSTKIPDIEGTPQDCLLKNGCSVISPVLQYTFDSAVQPFLWNYLHLPLWGRYYWINDWTFEDGFWIASCSVDPLASWRSQIGSSTQYVIRSSAESNGAISDALYPATTGLSFLRGASSGSFFTKNLNEGFYVVGIINNDPEGVGAVHYYVFDTAQFAALCSYLLGSPGWLGILDDDLSEAMQKALVNPLQYIVSCKWFPMSPPTMGDVVNLPYGWWNLTGVGCKRLVSNGSGNTQLITIDIPKHPQAARGRYLNCEPFGFLTLQAGPWGILPLNTLPLRDVSVLNAYANIDFISGLGRLFVYSTESLNVIDTIAQVGVNIQLAQMTSDILNTISTAGSELFGGIANIITANVGGSLMSGFNSVANTAKAAMPELYTTGTSGSSGSLVSYTENFEIFAKYREVVDDDNSDLGKPLCSPRQLSTIPGFQQILHPDISIPATESEISQIRQFMESGYFYE